MYIQTYPNYRVAAVLERDNQKDVKCFYLA